MTDYSKKIMKWYKTIGGQITLGCLDLGTYGLAFYYWPEEKLVAYSLGAAAVLGTLDIIDNATGNRASKFINKKLSYD